MSTKYAYPKLDGLRADEQPGLTLRQHYAGLAMQGLLANPARVPGGEVEGGPLVYASLVARVSLEFADALIAAEFAPKGATNEVRESKS